MNTTGTMSIPLAGGAEKAAFWGDGLRGLQAGVPVDVEQASTGARCPDRAGSGPAPRLQSHCVFQNRRLATEGMRSGDVSGRGRAKNTPMPIAHKQTASSPTLPG